MPIVQTYGPLKVRPDALPAARRSAADTAESLGAGVDLARANRDVQVAGLASQATRIGIGAAAQMIKDSRDAADQTALLEAGNALSKGENELLYDPNNGALTVKGKDAMGLPESVNDSFNKLADQVAGGLTTDRQQSAFARMRSERAQGVDLVIRRHVYGEMQTYQGQELQAFVDNAKNAAMANAQDPNRVGVEIGNALDAIKAAAPALGLGPEQIQKQQDAVRSDIHVGVIDNLLTAGKSSAARIYFEEAKDQISGSAIAKVQAAVKEGSVREQGAKQSDDIIAAGGTLTEQLDKAKLIDDVEVRDEVTRRLEHQASLDAVAERARSESQLIDAYNIIDHTKDVAKIPPAQWAALPGSSREALRVYADRLAKGQPIETDSPTYYGLMQTAAEDPNSFAIENLLKYRGKLDDGDFKQLAGIQLSIRNHDREKTDNQLAQFRTHSQIINDSLTQYGLDPTAKPTSDAGKQIAQLRRTVDEQVQQLEARTGKKAGNEDVQKMVDTLLMTTGQPGSWWGIFGTGFFGGPNLISTQKRLLDLTIDQVPEADKAKIKAQLTKLGQPISDTTILDFYIGAKAREKGGGG